jgi:hypothetical protein
MIDGETKGRRNISMLFLQIIAALVAFLFSSSHAFATNTPIVKKVMVLDFNPIIEEESGRRVREIMGWSNPTSLETQFINDISQATNGEVTYTVVQRISDLDQWFTKSDGFTYSDSQYMSVIRNQTVHHEPDIIDYIPLLNQFDVCGKRNRDEIDELWLWGGPWMGFWEATMTGPNSFTTNSQPITGTSCTKQLHIMAFSYERGVSEMLESFMHRVEGTMRHTFESSASEDNYWDKFTILDKYQPGQAACGTVHFAPNSMADYDWSNTRQVSSTCEDWLNFPNLTGARQTFGCEHWSCSGYVFKKWWLSHLPKVDGKLDGKLTDWWKYILNHELALFPADTNYDGQINLLDLNNLVLNFRKIGTTSDLNGDNIVNIYDYNVLLSNFGNKLQ